MLNVSKIKFVFSHIIIILILPEMRYIVLTHEYHDELIEDVNEHINKGWMPIGGISEGESWSQAMTKD